VDQPPIVTDAPERERYEAHLDGRLAGVVEYRDRPGERVFVHTEVSPAEGGHGIGGALARAALDDVRARGLAAVPMCPFIAAWIRRHPEYRALVPPEHLGLLDRRD
jgi:predicted GNAT family acetyltransferase